MSAEVLREAARLMRERATAATQAEFWYPYLVPDSKGSADGEWIVDSHPRFICTTNDDSEKCGADADHIASWHPAVALAVADLLSSVARTDASRSQPETHEFCDIDCDVTRALAVARAYLGDAS